MRITSKKSFDDSLVKGKKNNLKEVIIATSATVEGQTTALYRDVKNDKIKITKLPKVYLLEARRTT